MHNFVTHVNGGTVALQCLFDDMNGPVDTGAKAAGIGKKNLHHCLISFLLDGPLDYLIAG
jgi:hypothetical protein